MSVTPATLLLIIIMAFVCCLCSLVCINEITHLNYTDSDSEYLEKGSEDLVIDLSGLYVRSERIRDTINPLFNDSFIDLSQNSDSVV